LWLDHDSIAAAACTANRVVGANLDTAGNTATNLITHTATDVRRLLELDWIDAPRPVLRSGRPAA
jgi:hypothetical protein